MYTGTLLTESEGVPNPTLFRSLFWDSLRDPLFSLSNSPEYKKVSQQGSQGPTLGVSFRSRTRQKSQNLSMSSLPSPMSSLPSLTFNEKVQFELKRYQKETLESGLAQIYKSRGTLDI